MGLSYYVRFETPGKTTAQELEAFLQTVKQEAKRLGFEPAMVLNAKFATPAQQEFRKRLTYGATIQNDKLKGVVLAAPGQFWRHDPDTGEVRVLPKQAVVLVITDKGREAVLGFFRYPATLTDLNGAAICPTGLGKGWSQDFTTGADPRIRQLVKLFQNAGYVGYEKDEFAKPAGAAGP